MSRLIPIIGMEVHVELKTKSKMFCACENITTDREPNTSICPICLAHPGTLPLANQEAIRMSVLVGKALKCTIRSISKFDRKHYFYPDLPKGYQISQYDEPIAEYGYLHLSFLLEENPREEVKIGIRRAHLEEDTAKLTHDESGNTLIDFNRAGTPLVEIVTDPDFQTALEAKVYCQELQSLLRALRVSDANMELGQMRCEANISVQEADRFEIMNGVVKPLGDYVLNPKVELKNLNSFKAVERGIEYEIKRQTELIKRDEKFTQETRGWDEDRGESVPQRSKENAADYRYFPEPDLPPFHPLALSQNLTLPELPQAKRLRFHEEFGFSLSDARILADDTVWANFAEQVMSEVVDWIHSFRENIDDSAEIREEKKGKIARLAGSWFTTKLMGELKKRNLSLSNMKVSPENFAELISLVYSGRINSTNAQKLLSDMLDADINMDPTHLMEEKGYGQVSDPNILETAISRVITNFPTQVSEFQSGKEPVIKFLIGMVMKDTEGTADPKIIESLLRQQLIQ